MNNGVKTRFKVLLIAMCSAFLYGCGASKTDNDNISYDVEQTTGEIVSSRVDTYATMTGKVTTIHHDYYVTIKAKDGIETEFKSASLYDTYNEETGTQAIDYYKIIEYKNKKVEKITYQLTDEIPTNQSEAPIPYLLLIVAAIIFFIISIISFRCKTL